ncbi:cysteine ABC transporter permease, partial [Bacillus sp. ZZQ-131]
MYLSSALVSDRLSTWIDIMQSSFMPMLKEAVFTTIPLTLITFIIGIILATLTALARIS